MVLSPKGEDKYEMKYVPEDFDRYDQGFFGRAKPEYIIVKGECLEKLKQQGYEMDCWQKGIPLAINNKHPDSIKLKGFLTEYAKVLHENVKGLQFTKTHNSF